MQRQHFFGLTEPHPSHRFSCTASSFAHNASPPPHGETARRTQLKFRYLHRLDAEAIDRKYELLERLKRITRTDQEAQEGREGGQRMKAVVCSGTDGREKQYSIQSYYVFNQNEPVDRRYQLHRPLRNRSHDNIHLQAIPSEDLFRHQLKDHREFLQRFKPRPTGPLLAKRFRFNRMTHSKLRPFE